MQTSQTSLEPTRGTLYIVPTPIGNMADLTPRAIEVIQEAQVVAAEDTRRTGKLLHHIEVAKPMVSYHDHNAQQRVPELLNRLLNGESVALVSDAGMPLMSDPGYKLVKACLENDVTVMPLPGAAAMLAAVVASGLPPYPFVFVGFLPRQRGKLATLFHHSRQPIIDKPATYVAYESPQRLAKSLAVLQQELGGQVQVSVALELTKLHERFFRGSVEQVLQQVSQPPKGEVTVAWYAGT